MRVNILYFASLREALGKDGESLDLPAGIDAVEGLRDWLAVRHPALLTIPNLRAAVNQQMAGMTARIADGDEIAFFPPVTGG